MAESSGTVTRGALSRATVLSLVAVIVVSVVAPVGLRVLNHTRPDTGELPSFVPSIEAPRPRRPFDTERADWIRSLKPEFVVIGDSTARVQTHYLGLILQRRVIDLYLAASPVPYWYLAFKNLVVENNIPSVRGVVIRFRDDQLTTQVETRPSLLDEVARDSEPELDRVWASYQLGRFSEVHRVARTLYQYDRTRAWLEPKLTRAPASLVTADGAAAGLLDQINTRLFALDQLRNFAASDLQESGESFLDFDAHVDRSLLPEFIKLAERARMRLAFIRVQRRPLADGPPPQSPALTAYLEKLQGYLEEHGVYYGDDWGDPDQPLSIYSDGDHFKTEALLPYTDRFARKHTSFFQ